MINLWGRVTSVSCRWAMSTLDQIMACAWTAPSHYLKPMLILFVDSIPGKKIINFFNQNTSLFIEENTFEIVVCEMWAILSRGQCLYSALSRPLAGSDGICLAADTAPQFTRHQWWRHGYGIQHNPSTCLFMMTSWHGNAFRITDPLLGESTGDRWIPQTKGQ